MSFKNKVNQQTIGIGGNNYTVHAKIITTVLRSNYGRRHAIGAQRDHIQLSGVGSKQITVEGFTTQSYNKSNLWIIEMLQRWGKPVPFVSDVITTMAYIISFEYSRSADKYEVLNFRIQLIESRPIAGLLGEISMRAFALSSDKNEPIFIGGILTSRGGKTPSMNE